MLKPKPTIVVLCGGRGARLRPFTDSIPKAMTKMHGRPMLEHVIKFFYAKGFRKFIICIGYLGNVVEEHFSDWEGAEDATISFSNAGDEASMLSRLVEIKSDVGDEFIVTYGDTFIDLDVDNFLQFHRSSSTQVSVVTAEIKNPFGVVEMDTTGLVTQFAEKPVFNYYIGCFIMNKTAFAQMNPALVNMPDGEGLVSLFHQLSENNQMTAFNHSGLQITFNSEAEKEKAESVLQRFFTYKEIA